MASPDLRCRSFAKINWTLEILGKRPDGYHEIRTLLQTIDLHDRLRFSKSAGGIRISCSDPRIPSDETNLVHRAAALLQDYRGIDTGARIHLEKRIPAGGGLGGGSSNAAVTLLALNRLWKARLSPGELLGLARRLGSDVPFFLVGGTAIGVGRGEEIYPLPDRPAPDLLVVTPRTRVNTTKAYASMLTTPNSLSNMPVSCAAVFRDRKAPLVASRDAVSGVLSRNDFEPVIFRDYPEIRQAFHKMTSLGAAVVRLCGSGSSVFGLFDSSRARGQAMRGWPRSWGVFGVSAVGRSAYQRGVFEPR